jgi:predicted nucleic acid-binding protein
MTLTRPAFVLDCSVALTWCFVDEATPATEKLLERLRRESAIVPSLWQLEVANILGISICKGRISQENAAKFMATLGRLPIATDGETAARALTDTFALAVAHKLTAYDAAYLELAQRLDIPLASNDAELCKAAKKIKVELI